MMSNADIVIATTMTGDSPLLFDTSTMNANGSPYSIASAMPTTTTSRYYSFAPASTTSKPTVKDGWVVSTTASSRQMHSVMTASSPAATTEIAVFASPAPPLQSKPQVLNSLYIGTVVLVVVVTTVATVLVLFRWLRRRKKPVDQRGEGGRRPPTATEKPVPREPELSWMTGPTLIPEKDPHWSARTLVSPHEGHPQRGLTDQGVGRETIATAPPPIPPRSLSRRAVPVTARNRALPSPPAPHTSCDAGLTYQSCERTARGD